MYVDIVLAKLLIFISFCGISNIKMISYFMRVCVCVVGGGGGGEGHWRIICSSGLFKKKKKAVGVLRNVSNVQITVSDKSMPMRHDIITM